jgi:hypothetical protein
VIVKMIMEKQIEYRLAGETEVLGENVLQRHFCIGTNYSMAENCITSYYCLPVGATVLGEPWPPLQPVST